MSDSLTWVTSTHSASGNCIEVAVRDDVIVRDTKDRHSPVLRFTPQAWRMFASQVKTDAHNCAASGGGRRP